MTTETRIGQSRPETTMSGFRMRFSGPNGTTESSAALDFSLPAQLPGQAASSPIKTTRGNLKDVLYAQFISPYLATMYQDVYRQLSQLYEIRIIMGDARPVLPNVIVAVLFHRNGDGLRFFNSSKV